ncbi:MAG: T9SS type A sorting domain-containing protein, partial [Ignavibacteriaceae bacterium]
YFLQGHDHKLNCSYYRPGVDTIKFSALVENPNSHQTSSQVYIKSLEGSFIDSLKLNKTGLSGKSEVWTGNYLADSEDIYSISLSAKDLDESKTWTTDNITRFTTAGPVVLDSISFDTSTRFPYTYDVILFLKNESKIAAIKKASVKLTSNDSWIAGILGSNNLSDINPGSTIRSSTLRVQYIDSLFKGEFNFKVEIMSDGWVYWTDSMQVKTPPLVAINELANQPLTFKLEQNYPNPFNPSTKIKYSIPKQSYVTLKVFDILGRQVATLVNEEKPAGNYKVPFGVGQDSSPDIASGVYFYQIKAGDYVSTKKMILLK